MDSIGKIGLIMPQIVNNLDAEIVDIIAKNAAAHGYDTIMLTGVIHIVSEYLMNDYYTALSNVFSLIDSIDFSGIIIVSDHFRYDRLRNSIYSSVKKRNIPCVVIEHQQGLFPYIDLDQSKYLYIATEHLINVHQCRRICCIGGIKGDPKSEERILGFRNAMQDYDIPYQEEDIYYGDYWQDIPFEIGKKIASNEISRPDAVVCANDIMAVSLCNSLREHGISVPDDIIVTGYDGNMVSQLQETSITTVFGHERNASSLAISLLLREMGIQDVHTPPMNQELIVGESCGCCISPNKTRAAIRSYAGKVFDMHRNRKQFISADIVGRFFNCHELSEILGAAIGLNYMLPNHERMEIALCEDWYRNLEDWSSYRKSGFSERMILGVERDDTQIFPNLYRFSVAELFPSLSRTHKPRLTVVTCLHHRDQIFGYMGMTYQRAADIMLDEYFINWTDAFCNALNQHQNHMYQMYMKRNISSVSDLDPVLGIYNRRGIFEQLMLKNAEAPRTNYSILLISYVPQKTKIDSVPMMNAIANAFRLSNTEKCIIGTLDEKIIAVIRERKDSEPLSLYSVRSEIISRFEQTYNGTLKLSENQLAINLSYLCTDKLHEIEKHMDAMCDELQSTILSLQSGSVSYSQKIKNLREEIYKNPQEEWNLDVILHDLCISRSHFHRLYHELFSTSCKDDIVEARTTKAKWLLTNTNLSIAAVAEHCGYTTPSHFMHQFRKRTGTTASNYRKMYKVTALQ